MQHSFVCFAKEGAQTCCCSYHLTLVISCSLGAFTLYNSKLIEAKRVDRKGHKSQPSVREHDHIFKKDQENVEWVP